MNSVETVIATLTSHHIISDLMIGVALGSNLWIFLMCWNKFPLVVHLCGQ